MFHSKFLPLLAISAFTATTAVTQVPDSGPRLGERISRKPSPSSGTSIRVTVDLALVPVTVVDSYGRAVLGLTQNNFVLYDEKQPQRIVSFSRQDTPVSIGIVFDGSGSMKTRMADARDAVSELFRQLNPEDEVLLVNVGERPRLAVKLTRDTGRIADKLMFTRAGGMTALIDGVYLGLSKRHRAHNPRRALIVVSDGGDNHSRYNMKELLSLAAEADTQVYTIGLCANPRSREELDGPRFLETISRTAGGLPFVVNSISEMRDVMARIGITLHNQYVLGYYPPDDAPSGKYRRIRVKLKLPDGVPTLQTYARSGYYSPEN